MTQYRNKIWNAIMILIKFIKFIFVVRVRIGRVFISIKKSIDRIHV